MILTDDIKFYKKIKCLNDVKEVQEDVNNLFIWCNNNDRILNIDKCATVSFSQKKTYNFFATALITYICPVKILFMT